MNNIKSICTIASLYLLCGCGISKMTYKLPLNEDSEKTIYNVSSFSKTFGQLDTWKQTDTPYHLYLRSGYYSKNHFSLSLTAKEGKKDNTFYVKIKASHGNKFVRNVSAQQRKTFLSELEKALTPPTE